MTTPSPLLAYAAPTAGVTTVDVTLGLAVLATATVVLTARSRTTQVIAFLGLGVVMALAWLRLGSTDVGLAEAGLTTGLLSAVLVWLVVHDQAGSETRSGESSPAAPARWRRRLSTPTGLGIGAGVAAAGVLGWVWWRIDQQAPAWGTILGTEMAGTGLEHEVTGVLLAFRSYDTLLESAVLMLAGVAVLSLGRDGGLGQALAPVPPVPSGLRWFVRVSAPVLLLLALWLLFAGSTEAGGAFQSGAVLAGLLVLLHTAQVPMGGLVRRWLRPLLVLGVAVFLLAGLLGPVLGEAWLAWPQSWAYGVLLTVEVTLAVGVAAGLFLFYLALVNPGAEEASQ